MIVLQALLTWLSRSAGKFFQAAFGWAVVALFGPRPKSERTFLSAAVAAAAAWPLLVLGIFFPRIVSFVLAFVPFSGAIPRGVLRVAWASLAVAVPSALGVLLGRGEAKDGPRRWVRVAEGFPATLGIASAFLFVAIVAPVRKAVAFARRRVAIHVPVVVGLEAHGELADLVERVLRRTGFGLARTAAPFAEEAPVRLLRGIGGPLFRRQLPARLAAFRGGRLSVLVSPNGLALEGPEFEVMRLRGLLAEALTFSLALQTLDPEAQKLERRLQALVGARGTRAGSGDSLEGIAEALLAADVPGDDWQVLHRELLQAAHALAGREPLLMASAAEPPGASRRPEASGPTSPSTRSRRTFRSRSGTAPRRG